MWKLEPLLPAFPNAEGLAALAAKIDPEHFVDMVVNELSERASRCVVCGKTHEVAAR